MAAIAFPAGGGGIWLSHLIYCLENNVTPQQIARTNFHLTLRTTSIQILHAPTPRSLKYYPEHTITEPTWKVFSTKSARFNIYLNQIHKNRSEPEYQLCEIQENFKRLQRLSYSYLGPDYEAYLDPVDLEYDLLFTNPTLFLDNLFGILDEFNLSYTKNYEHGLISINSYKDTCVNPQLVVGNYTHILWLGWCLGIMQHLNMPIENFDKVKTFKDVELILAPHKELFVDFTKQYTLDIV